MDTTNADLIAIKQAMAKANELFNSEVFGKRNFAVLDQIYTEDARILPPGRLMVSGRQEIEGFWFDIIRSYNAKSTERHTLDLMPGGEGIVEVGRSVITAEPARQPEVRVDMKYVVFWKQEEGLWKWHVHIWNLSW